MDVGNDQENAKREGKEELRTVAIIALRDYLIELLEKQSWCVARTVGQALELLVGTHMQPVHPLSGMRALRKNETLP